MEALVNLLSKVAKASAFSLTIFMTFTRDSLEFLFAVLKMFAFEA